MPPPQSKGTIARRYPFNYQMSMGAYKTNDPIPGDVSLQITDQTPRNYYRVYASYLNGDDWDTLIGRDRGSRAGGSGVVRTAVDWENAYLNGAAIRNACWRMSEFSRALAVLLRHGRACPAIHVFVDCIKERRGPLAMTSGRRLELKHVFRSKP